MFMKKLGNTETELEKSFAYKACNRISIFILLSLNMGDENSHGLTSWNFSFGFKAPYKQFKFLQIALS